MSGFLINQLGLNREISFNFHTSIFKHITGLCEGYFATSLSGIQVIFQKCLCILSNFLLLLRVAQVSLCCQPSEAKPFSSVEGCNYGNYCSLISNNLLQFSASSDIFCTTQRTNVAKC